MEAMTADEIPTGPAWQYEPKWDGFRCLAFRDGDEIELQSKSAQTLTRYFPELVAGLRALKAKTFVLDGEIVVPIDGDLSFDELLQRIHPAESRVRKLAAEHPALLIVFDLLVDERGHSLAEQPLSERRSKLEAFAAKYFDGNATARLSPATPKLAEAKTWFRTMGGGLDGIIAKQTDLPYQAGERAGMQKIKNLRTADCVVGGFRYATKGKVVGSLLLGLYDEAGLLNHVGYTSSIHAQDKKDVTAQLEALVEPPGFTGRAPGGPSRWSSKRSTEWQPLAHKLVVEVQYDHFTGGRFRHGTKLLRWRPDKAPQQCLMVQVERESRSPLNLLSK
jgi:ATP-dependent DNA ligase